MPLKWYFLNLWNAARYLRKIRKKQKKKRNLKRQQRKRKPFLPQPDIPATLSKYYNELKDETDVSLRVGWESKESQEERFLAFLRAVPFQGKRVLDAGCGLGALYHFLREKGIAVSYVGIDLSKEFLSFAQQRYPEATWKHMDVVGTIHSFQENSFDLVVSSGLLNLRYENNMKYFHLVLERFLYLAKAHVVFNLLSDTSPHKEAPYYYYKKDVLISSLRELGLTFHIDDGYLANDMTVIISKHES